MAKNRKIPMTFGEWWNTVQASKARYPVLREIAEKGWNAALEAASALVADRYDETEPWMDPSDVIKLKSAGSRKKKGGGHEKVSVV